jgi:hypothetical protein
MMLLRLDGGIEPTQCLKIPKQVIELRVAQAIDTRVGPAEARLTA